MTPPLVLIVLDGWGIRAEREHNAIALARTPVYDALLARYPHAQLIASGEAVGLPAGQMGNSEVGHMNMGAGRIVYQDLTRIDKASVTASSSTTPSWRPRWTAAATGTRCTSSGSCRTAACTAISVTCTRSSRWRQRARSRACSST